MTTIPKHQQAERMALKLQWRAAVRSLRLAVLMSQRGGINGVETELAQLVELGDQARQFLTPVEVSSP